MIKLTAATDETFTFTVSSHSRPETHNIYLDVDNGWVCTCEQYYYRKLECKHIREVKEYLQENRNYTIVGIGYNHILELNPITVDYLINMGTYEEIKEWRQKQCLKSHQEMKLKV